MKYFLQQSQTELSRVQQELNDQIPKMVSVKGKEALNRSLGSIDSAINSINKALRALDEELFDEREGEKV